MLLIFLWYQCHFRLEELQVARDSFVSLEKKMTKWWNRLLVLLFSPLLTVLIARFYATNLLQFALIPIYFTCLMTFTLVVYAQNACHLFLFIRSNHRLAYETHKKSFLLLSVLTILSLGFVIWYYIGTT